MLLVSFVLHYYRIVTDKDGINYGSRYIFANNVYSLYVKIEVWLGGYRFIYICCSLYVKIEA